MSLNKYLSSLFGENGTDDVISAWVPLGSPKQFSVCFTSCFTSLFHIFVSFFLITSLFLHLFSLFFHISFVFLFSHLCRSIGNIFLFIFIYYLLYLGVITPQQGGLLVCRNGEELGLRQECEQKKLGPDGTTSGYVVPKKELLQEAANWRTTVFEPGDVVMFRSSLVHCTMINTTDKIRLSCDVRFVCMK